MLENTGSSQSARVSGHWVNGGRTCQEAGDSHELPSLDEVEVGHAGVQGSKHRCAGVELGSHGSHRLPRGYCIGLCTSQRPCSACGGEPAIVYDDAADVLAGTQCYNPSSIFCRWHALPGAGAAQPVQASAAQVLQVPAGGSLACLQDSCQT